MADDKDSGILAEFEEFLKAKQEAASNDSQAEDFEIEIWDEKGRGVRTRRSHAKPFLQSLGIDVDPPPAGDSDTSTDDGKTKPKPPAGRQASNTVSGSTARKYFTKPKP